jgi:hypothetical protein
MPERWKPVPGYEGLYEVSDIGRVKRCAKRVYARNRWGMCYRNHPPKIVAQNEVRGHRRVTLCKNGQPKIYFVHRLMALAFLGPAPPGKPLACHKDGRHGNNVIGNIYWGSHADNSQDQIRHGVQVRGDRCPGAKLREADVPTIRQLHAEGHTYTDIARRYGVNQRTIMLCVTRHNWKHIP